MMNAGLLFLGEEYLYGMNYVYSPREHLNIRGETFEPASEKIPPPPQPSRIGDGVG